MSRPDMASSFYDTTIVERNGVSEALKSKLRALKGLGIVEMMIGITCTICCTVLIIIFNNSSLTNVGYGIWGGLFFFIAGLLGALVADKRQNSKGRLLSATLNMSVIAACTSLLVISLSVMDLTERLLKRSGMSTGFSNSTVYEKYSQREFDASIAITFVVAILALIETTLSLISSVISSQVISYEKLEDTSQSYQLEISKTSFRNRFNKRTAKGLGITQIIIGVVCVVMNSVLIIFHSRVTADVSYTLGYGVWCGALFLIAGFIGIFVWKNQNCSSGSAVGMIILAFGGAAFAITLSTLDLTKLIYERNRYRYLFSENNNTNYVSTLTEYDFDIGGCFVIAFSAFVDAILTLALGFLCCKAACCVRTTDSPQAIPQPRPPIPAIPPPDDPPAYEEPDAQAIHSGYQSLTLPTDSYSDWI